MTTLLFVEHGNGQIKDGTLKALAAAKEIGAPIHALVLGTGSRAVAEAAGQFDGVEQVLNAAGGVYDHDLAATVSARPRRWRIVMPQWSAAGTTSTALRTTRSNVTSPGSARGSSAIGARYAASRMPSVIGPQPTSARMSCRIRDSSRETCIWVTPRSAPISSWVRSSKKRR